MTYIQFTILVHPSLVNITIYLVCLIYAWNSKEQDFLKKSCIFTIWFLWQAQAQEPLPQGSWNLQFWKTLLGHHYYIHALGLSDLCLGVEKKIFKEIMYLHHMTYMETPLHKTPYPGIHDICNFGRPFLGHHYYILVLGLTDLCLGLEKKIVKEIMYSHYITYMAAP